MLIDNAGIGNKQQVRYGDYPFVEIGYNRDAETDLSEPFPFDNPCIKRELSLEEAEKVLGAFLPQKRLKTFWLRHKRKMMFIIWRKGLWVQYYKKQTTCPPSVVDRYPKEIIDSYKELTHEVLCTLWREALQTSDATHYEQLIALTLERRDQLLAASK